MIRIAPKVAVAALVLATGLAAGLGALPDPLHHYEASDPANTFDPITGELTNWRDSGSGPAIDLSVTSGLFPLPSASAPSTISCAGVVGNGAKPDPGAPSSASLGNGNETATFEIWFKTDLAADRSGWQILLESGALTNGFSIVVQTSATGSPQLRIFKAFGDAEVADISVDLPPPAFPSEIPVQAIVVIEGSSTSGGARVTLRARSGSGALAEAEATGLSFTSVAGTNDSAVFTGGTEAGLADFGNAGGNLNQGTLLTYEGEIARIRMFDIALTSVQMDEAFTEFTDPTLDSDTDGMPDFYENSNGFNKDVAADAGEDADADSLTNLEEFTLGTHPRNSDSDGDGLDDAAEVSGPGDPLNPDTDADGLIDGFEVAANPFTTDPEKRDTDSDGSDDASELVAGTDPTATGDVPTTPIISEFMASNATTIVDGNGESSDWIEILNPTGSPIDLGGYFLTDDADALTKWEFPSPTIVGGNSYLLVFASEDAPPAGGDELHATFKLSGSGEFLALVAPDGTTPVAAFSPEFPTQLQDVSFAPPGLYHLDATPGAPNGTNTVSGFVRDTAFSHDRGYYDAPFVVTVSTPTPGATIVYTTDGSLPTPANGTAVPAPAQIPVIGTTVLRAGAFLEGLAPTNADTHTYLFTDDIIDQSDNPADYPYPNWDNLRAPRTADYGMDTDVVGPLADRTEVEAALRSLPVVALSTAPANLFDRTTGNYANSQENGIAWERPVSVEFFGFDHGIEIQEDCGLRLAGNAARSSNRHKHNMRLVFRQEYGPGRLRFPLFDRDPINTFNSVQLRGNNGDSWINPGVRDRATYVRDQWHRDVQRAMGQPHQDQRAAHLYINGLYWGVYHLFERVEDDFAASHFGGEEDEWDARDHRGPYDGDGEAWNTLITLTEQDLSIPPNYEAVLEQIDLDNFIDYMLLHFYSASDDWDQNNVRAVRRRAPGEKWIFLAWDQERTLMNSIASPTVFSQRNLFFDKAGQPTSIHTALTANPDYRLRFADRARLHLRDGGALSPPSAAGIWDALAAEIRPAIVAESARWGDLHGSTPESLRTPRNWEGRIAFEKAQWFEASPSPRSELLLGFLEAIGLYPEVGAPTFAPTHGGAVPSGGLVGVMAPAGSEVFFTTDGSDPMGLPAATGTSVTVDSTTMLRARARDSVTGEWSALTVATFIPGEIPDGAQDLVISEVNYNPPGDDRTEFVEILNPSTTATLTLSGVSLWIGNVRSFDFPDEFQLTPGSRTLVVRDVSAIESAYGPGLPVAGSFAAGTTLDNRIGVVALVAYDGSEITRFTYVDDAPWPSPADGEGASLTFVGPDATDPAAWRPSASAGGSPGSSDSFTFSGGSPTADGDGDGIPALVEHGLGTSDLEVGAPPLTVAADGTVSYRRALGADDVVLTLEVSDALTGWSAVAPVATIYNGDGTETRIYEMQVAPSFARLSAVPVVD